MFYMDDFDYLREGEVYLDAACQSLRPRPVIDAINKYYSRHNSCGECVKYKWGIETDEKVEETRKLVLKYLGLHRFFHSKYNLWNKSNTFPT